MMPKSPEQFPEKERDEGDSGEKLDYKVEKEKKNREKVEDVEGEIERLREEINELVREPSKSQSESSESREKRIKEYQKRFIPKHLRRKPGLISNFLINRWIKALESETEDKENIPEKGPFIVIFNHFGGGDAEAVLRTFRDHDLHLVVSKNIWWDSSAKMRWLLKGLRMIHIEESLYHLSEKEKEEAFEKQGDQGKKAFRKIIDREKMGQRAMNVEFTKQAVALLSRGDALGISPEGLWLNPENTKFGWRERKEMKKGYLGMELVARRYHKLTGEELPIFPTAFTEDKETGKKTLVIGKHLFLSENKTDLSGTDWCMAHVARMLPEEQRGYYKEMVRSLQK